MKLKEVMSKFVDMYKETSSIALSNMISHQGKHKNHCPIQISLFKTTQKMKKNKKFRAIKVKLN